MIINVIATVVLIGVWLLLLMMLVIIIMILLQNGLCTASIGTASRAVIHGDDDMDMTEGPAKTNLLILIITNNELLPQKEIGGKILAQTDPNFGKYKIWRDLVVVLRSECKGSRF